MKRRRRRSRELEFFAEGRDELNFAEFPLASVSNRYLDGTKTVVFEGRGWDRTKGGHVPKRLSISGCERLGLPTASDADVCLACVQLSHLEGFHSQKVHFSRYELLKLLRWPDETRYYRRVSKALHRWLGVSVISERAFYDKAQDNWVNRDFGVFDDLQICGNESRETEDAGGGLVVCVE